VYLVIDGQALQTADSRKRGIGRYSQSLIASLIASRPDWHIEVVQSTHLEPIEADALPHSCIKSFAPGLPVGPASSLANERYYGDWLTAQTPDALLLTSIFEHRALMPRFAGPRPPLFGVLYDLIPLLLHDHYLRTEAHIKWYADHLRQALSMDCLLSISQATAEDFRRLLPLTQTQLIVMGGGPDPSFAPLAEVDLVGHRMRLRNKFDLSKDFILYVGGCDFRKNLIGAMQAFAALPGHYRRNLDLVIACQLTEEERRLLQQAGCLLGLNHSLKLTGYVTDEELKALYQLCRVFLFPSLYEGLGLPVLEALLCGVPVVAANNSSIPEIAAPVSHLTDPSQSEMARALEAALCEPYELRQAERVRHAQNFCWEKSAAIACQAMQTIARPRRTRLRRHLAWVSPLPPAGSGIADYSAEILEHLAGHFEIDLVVDTAGPVVAGSLARDHLVLGAEEAAARHAAMPYDLFVFQMGNSVFHLYMLELLRRFGGLVTLHDYHLGGLVYSAVQERVWNWTLAEELKYCGEEHLLDLFIRGRLYLHELLNEATFNRRIVGMADALVVHSGWSWQRLRQAVKVPVVRIPLAVASPALGSRQQERARLGLPQDAFIICSLGQFGPPKRLDVLLRVVASMSAVLPANLGVWVVGETTPGSKNELLTLAQELGIGHRVTVTGRVPLDDFSAYARAADICVQLRYPTRGESSASVLRALAVGAVCVVSDQGPMAELPDDVVWKVRTPEHEVADLTLALRRLCAEPALGAGLAQAAVEYVKKNHAMPDVAALYAATIEQTIAQREAGDTPWVEAAVDGLARCPDRAAATALIEPWAALRHRGQTLMKRKARHRTWLPEEHAPASAA
jgi:glycosyltransferase involved in cell wall biosynthesis